MKLSKMICSLCVFGSILSLSGYGVEGRLGSNATASHPMGTKDGRTVDVFDDAAPNATMRNQYEFKANEGEVPFGRYRS